MWARVYVHSCSHLLSYITSLSSEALAERAINTTNEDLSPPLPLLPPPVDAVGGEKKERDAGSQRTLAWGNSR